MSAARVAIPDTPFAFKYRSYLSIAPISRGEGLFGGKKQTPGSHRALFLNYVVIEGVAAAAA
jgi:hypothetical protein